jgi:hypothetical protein
MTSSRVSPQQPYENITFLVDECFYLLSSFSLFFRFIDQFQRIWHTTRQWDNKKLYKIHLWDIFKNLLKNLRINLQPSYVWKIRTLNLWWPLLAMVTFSFRVSFWITLFCSIVLESKYSNHVWCNHNNTYHIKCNQCFFFFGFKKIYYWICT